MSLKQKGVNNHDDKELAQLAKLHPTTKELLFQVHAAHTATMGNAEKERHSLERIVKVKVNKEEKCLNVYYEHDWYHYTPKCTWY